MQSGLRYTPRAGVGAALAMLVVLSASSAFAQGRVSGIVKDVSGPAIKGATVRAENPDASPKSLTTTTDEKGRFAMIGLRGGRWTFIAEAPGYNPQQGVAQVRSASTNPPFEFRLAKNTPAGPLGALAGVNGKELQASLDAAESLYKNQQYDQAIDAYKNILAKTPQLTLINLQIGNAFRMKKDYASAAAAYEKVLEAEPTNVKARVGIGSTAMDRGDLAAADKALTAAVAQEDASRDAFYALGEVKFSRGESEEAAKWYQRASDDDPTWSKPVLRLAYVAVERKDRDGAIKMLERVIEMDPNSPEAAQAKTFMDQLKQ